MAENKRAKTSAEADVFSGCVCVFLFLFVCWTEKKVIFCCQSIYIWNLVFYLCVARAPYRRSNTENIRSSQKFMRFGFFSTIICTKWLMQFNTWNESVINQREWTNKRKIKKIQLMKCLVKNIFQTKLNRWKPEKSLEC